MNLDGCIGTGYRAQAATYTSGRIMNHREKITALGNFFGHRKDTLRTGLHAKLAAFAIILVDCDSGHFYIPLGIPI